MPECKGRGTRGGFSWRVDWRINRLGHFGNCHASVRLSDLRFEQFANFGLQDADLLMQFGAILAASLRAFFERSDSGIALDIQRRNDLVSVAHEPTNAKQQDGKRTA